MYFTYGDQGIHKSSLDGTIEIESRDCVLITCRWPKRVHAHHKERASGGAQHRQSRTIPGDRRGD